MKRFVFASKCARIHLAVAARLRTSLKFLRRSKRTQFIQCLISRRSISRTRSSYCGTKSSLQCLVCYCQYFHFPTGSSQIAYIRKSERFREMSLTLMCVPDDVWSWTAPERRGRERGAAAAPCSCRCPPHGRWKCLKVGGASSGRGHGERVEREPITGVWRRSPQWGPGAEPLVGGQGAKPPWSWKLFGSWTSHGAAKLNPLSVGSF